jgi:starch synthase
MSKNTKIKILMASAEVAPFAKVGGLADVTGSLPPALEKLNCDVKIVMPLYGAIDRKNFKLKKKLSNIEIISDKETKKINLWQAKLPNSQTTVYFIEHAPFFGKKEVYHGNDAERFLFFSLACLNILPLIKFQPDVIHCHDFHTALITDLLKTQKDQKTKLGLFLQNTKTLYTIHNLNYQGKSEIEVLSTGNLSKNSLKSLSKDARDGDINFMVQGIINADWVNTVSPTYAKEITTSAYGANLENIIKQNKNKLSGILNGIDIDKYNPAEDKLIKQKYDLKTLSKKADNKLYLQKILKLPQDKNIPIVGMITRLAWQKGLELISPTIEQVIKSNQPAQFVFLGTGQKEYETELKKLAKKYPQYVSANIMFDIKLAQQIYAGSDIFLMPSRFEPCGLGQMFAMRYGTVPIVRKTGGLADTVDKKTGFSFEEFTAEDFTNSLKKAINIFYKKPRQWQKLVKNCMKKDFSWDKSAKEYLKLYKKLIK